MVAIKSYFAAALVDSVRHENKGTVQEVTDIAYKGGSSLKVAQTYTPGYAGRYHSEVEHNHGYQRGDTLFYGFMFRLPQNWQFQPQSYNIAQFIANRPGAGCDGDDWMPSPMVWIQGNQLTSRIVSGHYRQPDCDRRIKTLNNLATIIMQVKWASDNSSFFNIWFNSNKVTKNLKVPTTVDDDSVFQFRVGLYANSWHDDGHMTGTQRCHQVWYDKISIGTELKDVDPDQD